MGQKPGAARMNAEASALPDTPAPHAGLQRWLVLVAAAIGVLLAAFGLVHAWESEVRSLRLRLYDTIELATCCAMFCIAWLIAWRAGHSVASLSIALALTGIFLSDALYLILSSFGFKDDLVSETIHTFWFGVGAALFIRAAQFFPELITAERIAASTTLWGRWKVTRYVLTALLRPAVLWSVAMGQAVISTLLRAGAASQAVNLCVIGLGIIYFYINYRGSDAEGRHKVLWFLAAAIATAAITLILIAVVAALGDGGSETLRMVIGVTLRSLQSIAVLGCIAAAVFYVGAISPSLVIRKTMVYGMTTALLLFIFASVEVFLHHQLVHWLGVTDTFASSLIGGVFGLAFHPVKHYLEHLLDGLRGKRPADATH